MVERGAVEDDGIDSAYVIEGRAMMCESLVSGESSSSARRLDKQIRASLQMFGRRAILFLGKKVI